MVSVKVRALTACAKAQQALVSAKDARVAAVKAARSGDDPATFIEIARVMNLTETGVRRLLNSREKK